jgi:flagellar biosynthetic protein FlhB
MPLEDKTEAPTPRRRKEAREEGQVARSVDLSSAIGLLAALLILRFTVPSLAARLRGVMIGSLTNFPTHDLTLGDLSDHLVRLLLEVGVVFAPLVLGVAIVGFGSTAMQVGLVISGKPLQPKAERLNPIAGMARMFSAKAGVELIKAIVKVVAVGYIVFAFLRDNAGEITGMVGADYRYICSRIGALTWDLLLRATIVMFVIAALDYLFQRYQHEKQLRMTKQELKEDNKRTEGDPLVKSKIRQKQREAAQKRMMHEVPKADVVVTNPTHFAIALRYEPDKSPAPVVVGKGRNLMAQKIREIAEENKVPIVENVPLARALYASVEIGDQVPTDLYQAVAEILAYVYRLSNKVANAA